MVKYIVYAVKRTSLYSLKECITTATRTILIAVPRAAPISTGLRKFVSPVMTNATYCMVSIVFCGTLLACPVAAITYITLHSLCVFPFKWELSADTHCFVIV